MCSSDLTPLTQVVPPLHDFLTKPQAAEPVGSWFDFWLCHLLAVSLGKSFNLPGVWAFLVAQMVRIHLQCRRPWFESSVGNIPWRRDRLPTQVFMGFPGGSDSKESAWNAGDLGSIPQLGRSPGEKNGYPLQYSCLENPMDRGARRAIVTGITQSQTRLSD